MTKPLWEILPKAQDTVRQTEDVRRQGEGAYREVLEDAAKQVTAQINQASSRGYTTATLDAEALLKCEGVSRPRVLKDLCSALIQQGYTAATTGDGLFDHNTSLKVTWTSKVPDYRKADG